MGFEEAIPPIPTRQQELRMIEEIEKSWLSQPFYKYYMNENLRRKKMQYSDKRNKVRAQYCYNFVVYGLLMMPVAFIMGRFARFTSTGLPIFHQPYHFFVKRTSQKIRNSRKAKIQIPFWLLTTFLLAKRATDRSSIEDENMEQAKDYPML